MSHSLAKNDAIFEAVHEVVAYATSCHPLDPLSKLLLPMEVILLGQLGVGDTDMMVRMQVGGSFPP